LITENYALSKVPLLRVGVPFITGIYLTLDFEIYLKWNIWIAATSFLSVFFTKNKMIFFIKPLKPKK
jgi:hypothetical protein